MADKTRVLLSEQEVEWLHEILESLDRKDDAEFLHLFAKLKRALGRIIIIRRKGIN